MSTTVVVHVAGARHESTLRHEDHEDHKAHEGVIWCFDSRKPKCPCVSVVIFVALVPERDRSL